MMRPLPSAPQAKLLASRWGNDQPIRHSAHGGATQAVCIRKGWCEPDGSAGVYPSGETWAGYRVSTLGLFAIENFLMNERHKGGVK